MECKHEWVEKGRQMRTTSYEAPTLFKAGHRIRVERILQECTKCKLLNCIDW